MGGSNDHGPGSASSNASGGGKGPRGGQQHQQPPTPQQPTPVSKNSFAKGAGKNFAKTVPQLPPNQQPKGGAAATTNLMSSANAQILSLHSQSIGARKKRAREEQEAAALTNGGGPPAPPSARPSPRGAPARPAPVYQKTTASSRSSHPEYTSHAVMGQPSGLPQALLQQQQSATRQQTLENANQQRLKLHLSLRETRIEHEEFAGRMTFREMKKQLEHAVGEGNWTLPSEGAGQHLARARALVDEEFAAPYYRAVRGAGSCSAGGDEDGGQRENVGAGDHVVGAFSLQEKPIASGAFPVQAKDQPSDPKIDQQQTKKFAENLYHRHYGPASKHSNTLGMLGEDFFLRTAAPRYFTPTDIERALQLGFTPTSSHSPLVPLASSAQRGTSSNPVLVVAENFHRPETAARLGLRPDETFTSDAALEITCYLGQKFKELLHDMRAVSQSQKKSKLDRADFEEAIRAFRPDLARKLSGAALVGGSSSAQTAGQEHPRHTALFTGTPVRIAAPVLRRIRDMASSEDQGDKSLSFIADGFATGMAQLTILSEDAMADVGGPAACLDWILQSSAQKYAREDPDQIRMLFSAADELLFKFPLPSRVEQCVGLFHRVVFPRLTSSHFDAAASAARWTAVVFLAKLAFSHAPSMLEPAISTLLGFVSRCCDAVSPHSHEESSDEGDARADGAADEVEDVDMEDVGEPAGDNSALGTSRGAKASPAKASPAAHQHVARQTTQHQIMMSRGVAAGLRGALHALAVLGYPVRVLAAVPPLRAEMEERLLPLILPPGVEGELLMGACL